MALSDCRYGTHVSTLVMLSRLYRDQHLKSHFLYGIRRRWASRYVLVFLLIGVLSLPALSQEKLYSISAAGSFTSSSRLFYNIEATDEFARSQYIAFRDIFGFGFDVRRIIEDTRLQVGISAEYLSTQEKHFQQDSLMLVPVENGYWIVPIELSGYFTIPFSSSTIRLYIGGGGGVYFGEGRYSKAEERASIVDTKNGFGIHVVTGVEYALAEWFALRGELKFRDLQFESTHTFTKSFVNYRGRPVRLDQTPSPSRVNVDGMVFHAGIVVRW